MSSRMILRSKSPADITSPHAPSHFKVSPPSQSVRSSRSTGLLVAAWSKKLGECIKGDTKNSNLTEACLQEFNRRNALIKARYNSSSPYYIGLTDFSLVIGKEKLTVPGTVRESHAASIISPYYKGLTDFSLDIQRENSQGPAPEEKAKQQVSSVLVLSPVSLSRCRNGALLASPQPQETMKRVPHRVYLGPKYSMTARANVSSSSKTTENEVTAPEIKAKTTRNDSEHERRYVIHHSMKDEDTMASSTKEKPLKERNYELLPMLPLPPLNAPPPELLPYPLPQITPPTAQSFPLPPSTPLSEAQTTPTPPTAVQKPTPQTPYADGVTCENQETNTTENENNSHGQTNIGLSCFKILYAIEELHLKYGQ